jgi:hypothetical protein
VIVTRQVQASDVPADQLSWLYPNPGIVQQGTTTYQFGTSATQTTLLTSFGATWQVQLFNPHMAETLSVVNTTNPGAISANVGDTLTYTVHLANDSSANSPPLVRFGQIIVTFGPTGQQVVLSQTIPNLNPGDSFDFTYTHVVTLCVQVTPSVERTTL